MSFRRLFIFSFWPASLFFPYKNNIMEILIPLENDSIKILYLCIFYVILVIRLEKNNLIN